LNRKGGGTGARRDGTQRGRDAKAGAYVSDGGESICRGDIVNAFRGACGEADVVDVEGGRVADEAGGLEEDGEEKQWVRLGLRLERVECGDFGRASGNREREFAIGRGSHIGKLAVPVLQGRTRANDEGARTAHWSYDHVVETYAAR